MKKDDVGKGGQGDLEAGFDLLLPVQGRSRCGYKDEGGRHTPFFKGYRPQFYFRTTDVTGVAQLPAGMEMVMPGDNVQLEIELITPIAMDKGLRFAIREGGRTVGFGTVSGNFGITDGKDRKTAYANASESA